jgi:hypothetical protein
MKTTLALIALCFSTTAFAQSEPEIRIIGAGASAGGAQDSIGSGGSEKRSQPALFINDASKSREDVVRTFLLDYSRCVVNLDKRGAARLMDMIPGTAAYTQMAKRVAVNSCMAVGDMKITHSALQGALYAYRYRADFGTRAPALKTDPIDYAAIAGSAESPWAGRYVAYHKLAQCVVRADPIAARALVMAPIGSANETGAVQTLAGQLGTCLDKGATVNLTKERLTGLVAEALYRLSVRDVGGN